MVDVRQGTNQSRIAWVIILTISSKKPNSGVQSMSGRKVLFEFNARDLSGT